jgi:hypothetical protein
MLWATDQSVEGAEEAGDTDNLWHMGLVVANTVERPADWPWRGHRAVVAGGTTEPVLLGPVKVIRANRRHLVVDTMGLLRGEVFPDGDPAVEVVHGEDWTGVRWPGLPMGRGVAAVLFVLFWAGVAFAIRSPFVSRETYPRTSPPEMES